MRFLMLMVALAASPLPAEERAANHLLGQSSPYLQQHIYNSVDWHPWGEAAFAKARAEGKLIFLSVGYAACHWCRVMSEESFEDDTVGAYLNAHFVAIKMDREERPDLDEQFLLVTQTATGGGGWPNSVFLTPAGAPFYGGGYYPREAFLEVLDEINQLWINDRAEIENTAAALGDVVRGYMNRKARARAFTPDLARAVSMRMLGQMDEFNGGFGVAPKFPQEMRLLYLLDQFERGGEVAVLEAVQRAARGMVDGGIHDQVGGGFHRYTIDNEWAVPHFEKMLYTQALIGRLLTRAHYLSPEPDFARAAQRSYDYILRDMQAPEGGFYTSEDADSLNDNGTYEEGLYYIWTPAQIHAVAGEDAALLIEALNVIEDEGVEGFGVLRRQPFEGALGRLETGLEGLRNARLARIPPLKDTKILLGWNAEVIISLVEGAEAYARPDYLAAAQKAARFVLENMQKDERYYRVYINGAAHTEAQLPDYAGFGRALLALHDVEPNGGWLLEAARIARFVLAHFQEESGLFRMNMQSEGLGPFIQLDDNELPSGNAQMQRLLSGLARRSADVAFAQQAAALSDILSGGALSFPEQRAGALAAVDAQNRGDTGPFRALASGAVTVRANAFRDTNALLVSINIAEGWHINAQEPLQDYLIPTEIRVNGRRVPGASFPAPLITKLAFNAGSPLALYQGEITLHIPIKGAGQEVQISLQACSDEICLAPEVAHFRFR